MKDLPKPKKAASFVGARALAIAQKELIHVWRDPFTLALALGLPLFLVFVFGIAIEFNIKNIHMVVFDADHSRSSRLLLENFSSSNYFIVEYAKSPQEAQKKVRAESDRVALIIPENFEKNLLSGTGALAQVLIDGSDNSSVGPVAAYLARIQTISNKRLAEFETAPLLELKTRYLFNPELNSKWFIIPGLIAFVMGVLSILLTALTVAREWENGSMELLLSTPVQPLEIVMGKLAPYSLIGMFSVVLVYSVARLFFGVPFVGSLWILGLGCLIFLAAYLAQGLLISVLTRKQQVAMQLAMITGLLPVMLLSGFIFPIQSMPTFFQYLTGVLSARWFMNIIRQTFLEGSSLWQMKESFLALSLIATILIVLSVKKFKKDLEP